MHTFSLAETEVDLHSFTKMPSYSGIKARNLLKNHLLLALWKEVKQSLHSEEKKDKIYLLPILSILTCSWIQEKEFC